MILEHEIEKHILSDELTEYLGGDVQGFVIATSEDPATVKDGFFYTVWQRPHRGNLCAAIKDYYALDLVDMLSELEQFRIDDLAIDKKYI